MADCKRLTNHRPVSYNKGEPIRCKCGRVDAFIKDDILYVKCRDCRDWIPIVKLKKYELI